MSTVLGILLLTALPDISSKDYVSADKQTFFSFRPGESDKSGAVWIERRTKAKTIAGHGHYSLFEVNGEPRLRLNIPRLWNFQTTKDAGPLWWFDDMYYGGSTSARSVECEIVKSKEDFIITVLDFGKCSRNAVWTGTTQALSNDFFDAGEIVRIRPAANYDPLAENALPCYVIRAAWKNRSKTHPKNAFEVEALDSDWYGWGRGPFDPFYIFSFQPSAEHWFEGEAWLVSLWKEPASGHISAQACKGKYEFTANPAVEMETLALQFTTRRIYTAEGRGDAPFKWSLMVQDDLDRFPGFVEFSVPLTDRGFSATRQPLILDDASYINSAGKKTLKTYSDGFLKLNTRVDDPKEVLNLGEGSAVVFASGILGATIPLRSEIEQKYMARLDESLPPGLELRPFKVSQTVARPVIEESPPEKMKPDYKKLLEEAENEFRNNPKDPEAAGHLAWLLVTMPDDSLRNAKRAIPLATRACNATNFQDSLYVETLAAACAENKDFKTAIYWQLRAIKLADESEREGPQLRLNLYQRSLPYREE